MHALVLAETQLTMLALVVQAWMSKLVLVVGVQLAVLVLVAWVQLEPPVLVVRVLQYLGLASSLPVTKWIEINIKFL